MSSDLAQFVHDARGSLGSMRLSIEALLDEDDDPAFRQAVLHGVGSEIRRLVACLEALPVVLTEARGPIIDLDVAPLVRGAARRAGSQDVVVEVSAPDAFRLSTALIRESVERALAAALVLAAGAKPRVTVRLDAGARELVIAGGERWPMAEHLLGGLATLLGATPQVSASGVTLRWHDG